VGIVVRAKIGDRIEAGEPIGEVHARDDEAVDEAVARVNAAITLGEADVAPPRLVHGWFG
jgi:thymidine phosphorylase